MTLFPHPSSIMKPLFAIITMIAIIACSNGQADEANNGSANNSPDEAEEAASSVPTAASANTATPAENGDPEEEVEIDRVAEGKKVFRSCVACHTLEKDDRHRIGPNLWNIAGSTAGTRDGFKYSKAMTASGTVSGIVWDDANLDAFLENPRKFIPNNRMAFGGVRNAEKRSYLIEYIKTYSEE